MTVSLTSLANNQSFGTLIQRVDDIVAVFASNAVTTDATIGGGITTGNGFVNGNFGSVVLFAGNSVANVFSNSTSLNASWGLSGNLSGFYVNNAVYSNSFTTSQAVVNTSGVFAVNSLNSNTLYIANNLVVNGVTTYAQALHVNSNVNTATLNALSSIYVGATFSITPTTLAVGNTSLNTSAYAGDKVIVGNSTTNTIFTGNTISTTWGIVGNGSGFYSNLVFTNVLTTAVTTINATGAYTNLITCNNFVSNLTTANSTGLYANLATINNFSCGLTSGNSTVFVSNNIVIGTATGANTLGIYCNTTITSNNISVGGAIIGNTTALYSSIHYASVLQVNNSITANSLGLYVNVITTNSVTHGTTICNTSGVYANQITCNNFTSNLTTANSIGLYANLATINNFVCGQTAANSIGFYTNNITVNTSVTTAVLTVGTSTINLSVNSTSLIFGNSSFSFLVANLGGLSTNGNMTVSGNLYVTGNTISSGTSVGTGDYIPSSNSYNLGNTTNRWNFWALNANVAANATIGANLAVACTVIVGSGTTSTINGTSFSGTANNSLYLGGIVAASYPNTVQLTNNLANYPTNTQFVANLLNYPTNTQFQANLGNYVLVNTAIAVGNTTSNISVNTTVIAIGNSGTSATVNSTVYSGTANNASYIGGLIASNVVSNAQLTNNLANYPTNTQFQANLGNYTNTTTLATNYPNTNQLAANMSTTTSTASLPAYLSSYTGNLTVNVVSVGNLVSIGNASVNVVASATSLKVSNSTVTWSIISPNTVNFSNGQYFLSSNGVWTLGSVTTGNVITTGTSTQNVDSFPLTSYAAEYFLTVGDNNANNKYITSIILSHDGTNSYITEYGSITTNSYLGAFEATTNATFCTLNFTPTSTNTTIRFSRTIIT